jgi:hypothetical protein
MTTMQMPSSVRIGPLDYKITPMEPMEGTKFGNFGWFHSYSQTISYRNDVAEQQKAHILMHEMLHGIWYTADLADEGESRDVEESYVTKLAQPLCDLIRNNPEVIAWISQTLASKGEQTLQVVPSKVDMDFGAKVEQIVRSNSTKMDPETAYTTSVTTGTDPKTVYVNNKPTLWA